MADNGWRIDRVRAIHAELDRHWAAATLAAVRQDDPLAFGIDRLRSARVMAAADLAAYGTGLPPDRSATVTEAKRTLAAAEQDLRQSRAELVNRGQYLELATERHWGRRDKEAVATAVRSLERAEVAVTAAEAVERDARSRLDAEASDQQRRETALSATEPQRADLTQALAEIDAALDDTRAQRVAALSAEAIVPAHLAAVVNEVPSDPGARQVWCALACRIESYRDRHPDALGHEAHGGVVAAIGPRPAERWMPDPEWDDLAGQLRHGAELVAVADHVEATGVNSASSRSWVEVLDHADARLEAQGRTADHGLDDHGLGLGL